MFLTCFLTPGTQCSVQSRRKKQQNLRLTSHCTTTACQSTSYDTRIERELVNELPSENLNWLSINGTQMKNKLSLVTATAAYPEW